MARRVTVVEVLVPGGGVLPASAYATQSEALAGAGRKVIDAERLQAILGVLAASLDENGFLKQSPPGWLSVSDPQYGAVGYAAYPGSSEEEKLAAGADETARILDAAADARARKRGLLLPEVSGGYLCSALDLTEIRFIDGRGYIRSRVTAGYAVEIGTKLNANTQMTLGDIRLNVSHEDFANDTHAGVHGVRIYGASRCAFDIAVSYYDIGVHIYPKKQGTAQYVADCDIRTSCGSCRIGVEMDTDLEGSSSSAAPFVNENRLYPKCSSGSLLPGEKVGVKLVQGNNNYFPKPWLENLDVPLWFVSAVSNKAEMARLENSGAVRFGDGDAAHGACNNVVTAAVTQGNFRPTAEHMSPRLNFCIPAYGPEWATLARITADDWNGDDCPKLFVADHEGGHTFTAPTIDSSARSFSTGSGENGAIYVPVLPGDIVAIDTEVLSGSNWFKVTACGEDMGPLPTLTSGEMPYIGTLRAGASIANSASGTANSLTATATNFPLGFQYVGASRSEVKYLRIELIAATVYRLVQIRKLLQNGGNDIRLDCLPRAIQ